jgi:predicted dithiol-disulfide oxidoreductase (DUF899 family)
MTDHKVGSREQWLAAVPVEKEYRFDSGGGTKSLSAGSDFNYRAPRGRDEGDSSQFWIRRHDEYE